MAYKWTNMENSFCNFYFGFEKWQQRYQKTKKNQTVAHIESAFSNKYLKLMLYI